MFKNKVKKMPKLFKIFFQLVFINEQYFFYLNLKTNNQDFNLKNSNIFYQVLYLF